MDELQEKIISGKITALEVGWQSRAFLSHDIMKDISKLLEEKGFPKRLEERLRKLMATISGTDQVI